jgi:hypothetical protein
VTGFNVLKVAENGCVVACGTTIRGPVAKSRWSMVQISDVLIMGHQKSVLRNLCWVELVEQWVENHFSAMLC